MLVRTHGRVYRHAHSHVYRHVSRNARWNVVGTAAIQADGLHSYGLNRYGLNSCGRYGGLLPDAPLLALRHLPEWRGLGHVHIVMAHSHGLYCCGLYSYGLYSYGLRSHGLHCCGLYSYGYTAAINA